MVEFVVTGHMHYGLTVRTPGGEPGSVDSDVIADRILPVQDWPSVGQAITGVVLGYDSLGRLRVCAQPSYVDYVRSAADIRKIQDDWARLHGADQEYAESARSLLRSEDARGVLRWALSNPPRSAQRRVALRVLARAPSEMVLDFMGDLVGVVLDGGYDEEVGAVLGAVGVDKLGPALLRSVTTAVPTVQQYTRLAEFLINLGATRPLHVLIDKMLESDDPDIRSAGTPIHETARE